MGAPISWTVSDHQRRRRRHHHRRHHLSWIVFSLVALQPYRRHLHSLLLRTQHPHQHRSPLAQNH
ncbi:hypothetical protein Hanom_Chr02g00155561 [Helianthus anomalus]